jgi:hypothetical protein
VSGGFIPPEKTQIPTGGAWQPIEDMWEYDPAADSWKALAPMPTKRGRRCRRRKPAANLCDRRRYDGGRFKGSVLHLHGTGSGSQHERVYDPRPTSGKAAQPMAEPRNHAFAARLMVRFTSSAAAPATASS